MDKFAKDFYMVLGVSFCGVGLITLIVTWLNIPFFFVLGVIFFLLGVEVIKVPTPQDLRNYVNGIKAESATVKKRTVKKVDVKHEKEAEEL
jgi:hypothetical protein